MIDCPECRSSEEGMCYKHALAWIRSYLELQRLANSLRRPVRSPFPDTREEWEKTRDGCG
jgi:hypothetical protein